MNSWPLRKSFEDTKHTVESVNSRTVSHPALLLRLTQPTIGN